MAERLKAEAAARGESSSALAEELIDEGLRSRRHPLVTFRDGPTARRAALVGGPDIWEVVGGIVGGDAPGGERIERATARSQRSRRGGVRRPHPGVPSGRGAAAGRHAGATGAVADEHHAGIVFTSPRRYHRGSTAYPANLLAVLSDLLVAPSPDRSDWVHWLP